MTRPVPAPVNPRPSLADSRRASWMQVGLLGLMLTLAVGLGLSTPAGLGQLRYPAESAGRLSDRHWYFYEGYERTGAAERAWHRLLFGAPEQVRAQNIDRLREVIAYFAAHPESATSWAELNARARLLVGLAESGRREALTAELSGLGPTPEEDTLGAALRYAYGLPGAARASRGEVVAGLNFMPLGWAADRLALRIAERDGNLARVRVLGERLAAEGRRLRSWTDRMGLLTGALLLGGGVALLAGPWRRSEPAPALPDWPLREGLAVLLWSALAAVAIAVALHWQADSYFRPGAASAWSALFAGLPMLWLIRRRLLVPAGTGLLRAFGLTGCGPPSRLLSAGLGLFALERSGALLLAWLGAAWGGGAHWAQGVTEPLMFGPARTVWLLAVALVLWTPLVEEIAFRGLLYRTLAQRWRAPVAGLLAAAVFAALHGYAGLASVSVAWTALVLTWGYQRTGSLWPCILAHGLSNAFTLAIVVAFYR